MSQAVRGIHIRPAQEDVDGPAEETTASVQEATKDVGREGAEGGEDEWFQWTPRQPDQPHYPSGNRLGSSVRPLSVRLWSMSKPKGPTQNRALPNDPETSSTIVGLATLAEAGMTDFEQSFDSIDVQDDPYNKRYTGLFKPDPKSLSGDSASIAQPDVTHWPEISPVSVEYPTLQGERRKFLLDIIANTPSITDAWNAYHELANMQLLDADMPHAQLHRLAALVAHVRPRSRALFIRLVSVLSKIHRLGGQVCIWEWNALIDYAGKGFRRTRQEDFQSALDVYEDLINNRPPGASLSRRDRGESRAEPDAELEGGERSRYRAPTPDVVTLSTLLNLAIRAQDDSAVERVYALFEINGVAPNRISHLMLIDYYSKSARLSEVQRLVSNMRWEGHELGLDGLNNVMWAYAKNARFTIPNYIYQLLKHNRVPSELDVQVFRDRLEELDIIVRKELVPDHATYMIMLQSYAYQGQFRDTILTFADLIVDSGRLQEEANGRDRAENPRPMSAALILEPAYRAIFLGFRRWGRAPPAENRQPGPYKYALWHSSVEATQSEWTFAAWQALFDDYMTLPDIETNQRIIYWQLMAVARMTGNDRDQLRVVYERLAARFPSQWGYRLQELKKWIDGQVGAWP